MEIREALTRQAVACEDLGSPMYAELMSRVVEDLSAGGPAADVLAGHEDDPGPSALGLRLLGSVHRLVLERRAGSLVTFYPSVGGRWEAQDGWCAFHATLAQQPEVVREWLDRPPQTNEVGRAGALVGGLLRLQAEHRHPVRLFEMGASGGLNLLADRFAYRVDGEVVHGDPSSPVQLDDAWRGEGSVPWPDLRFATRRGGDVMPVDARSTEGRLRLAAYVWPDQIARFARLRGALDLAAREPYEVVRQGAVEFVADLELQAGHTTVLWHSVMWQYLTETERGAVRTGITTLGAQATDDQPFVHLCLEPTRRDAGGEHEFLVVGESWPGGGRRVLGTSVGHGLPTTWE